MVVSLHKAKFRVELDVRRAKLSPNELFRDPVPLPAFHALSRAHHGLINLDSEHDESG